MRIVLCVGLASVLGCRDYEKVIPPEQDNDVLGAEDEAQEENISEDGTEEENNEGGNSTPSNGSEEGSGSNGNPNQGESEEELNPDYLVFTFSNGYQNTELSEVNTASGALTGEFSAVLIESSSYDYCSVDWIFDSSTVEEDVAMKDGYVTSFEEPLETWFGYVITSSPQKNGNCSNMGSMSQGILESLVMEQPTFGYGPLSPGLEYYLTTDNPSQWNEIEDYVFSGIISLDLFSEYGEKTYLDLNIGYAYAVADGTSSWNNEDGFLQGGELMVSDLPSDALYTSTYFYAIPLQ